MTVQMNIVKETILLNLPDKTFFDICSELYGINRGVYNVIDDWLFHNGYEDIESRRQTIIMYLDYLQMHHIKKFGKGGVKNSLELFLAN